MIAGLNNKRQGGAGGVFLGHFMTMKPALILSSMLLMLVSSSALLLAAESENVGVSSFNNKGFEQDADSTTNTYAAGKRVLVSDIVSSSPPSHTLIFLAILWHSSPTLTT
jgi:hypothetical protein